MSTAASHIELDESGVAWIADANTKVIEVVLDKLAYDWSPEEICSRHHGHLSLAQIQAALAYYDDHKEKLDADIERRRRRVEAFAAQSADAPLQKKLLALMKQR